MPVQNSPSGMSTDKADINDLDSSAREDNVKITFNESPDDKIVAEKNVEIEFDKEETDVLIENENGTDDLTKSLLWLYEITYEITYDFICKLKKNLLIKRKNTMYNRATLYILSNMRINL